MKNKSLLVLVLATTVIATVSVASNDTDNKEELLPLSSKYEDVNGSVEPITMKSLMRDDDCNGGCHR